MFDLQQEDSFINVFREPEYVELESTDEYVKVPVRIGPDKTYQ